MDITAILTQAQSPGTRLAVLRTCPRHSYAHTTRTIVGQKLRAREHAPVPGSPRHFRPSSRRSADGLADRNGNACRPGAPDGGGTAAHASRRIQCGIPAAHSLRRARARTCGRVRVLCLNMGCLLGWGCACLRTCVHGLVCVARIMSSMNRWSDQMCAGL